MKRTQRSRKHRLSVAQWHKKLMRHKLKRKKRRAELRQAKLLSGKVAHPERNRLLRPFIASRTTLVCPKRLDFEDHTSETIAFLRFLHSSISQKRYRNVIIDHRPLVKVSPAAILALLAHTHNAMADSSKVKLSAILPTHEKTLVLLHASGYLRYYSVPFDAGAAQKMTGILGHIACVGVDNASISKFVRAWPMNGIVAPSRLYEALIEAATNADEWGYERNKAYRRWWLLALRKPSSPEIAFCFLDLGQGIPATIRTRLKDQLFLIKPTGSELICKAVMQGHYSRTKKGTRGNGLPTLKRLVDHAEDGELLVISDHSIFRYRKNRQPDAIELGKGTRLQGTLIAWSIRKQ